MSNDHESSVPFCACSVHVPAAERPRSAATSVTGLPSGAISVNVPVPSTCRVICSMARESLITSCEVDDWNSVTSPRGTQSGTATPRVIMALHTTSRSFGLSASAAATMLRASSAYVGLFGMPNIDSMTMRSAVWRPSAGCRRSSASMISRSADDQIALFSCSCPGRLMARKSAKVFVLSTRRRQSAPAG